MVSNGVISREFAVWSSFVKLQILLTPCLHEVRRLFLFMASQPLLVTYLHTVVVATLILWSWSFLPLCVVEFYVIPCTYNFFKSTSHPFFLKKWPSTLWFVFRSLYFWLLVHLSFRLLQQFSNFFWLNGQKTEKIDALANSVGLHFRER